MRGSHWNSSHPLGHYGWRCKIEATPDMVCMFDCNIKNGEQIPRWYQEEIQVGLWLIFVSRDQSRTQQVGTRPDL